LNVTLNGIGVSVQARIFKAGYCTGPGKIADKSMSMGKIEFPAPFALIKHPRKGLILFDTGYHPRFHDCTGSYPERFFAMSTPCFVSEAESAKSILEGIDIDPSSIEHIVLSHLHADHVAGVLDFSDARFYSDNRGWQFLKNAGRFSRIKKGYLADLLPDNFEERSTFVSDYPIAVSSLLQCSAPSAELWANDLFDDGLIYVVNLPGHARGHTGLLCRLEKRWLFLLADACWLQKNLVSGHEPHTLAALIFDNKTEFSVTLKSLKHYFENAVDKVDFVPAHCSETIDSMVRSGWLS